MALKLFRGNWNGTVERAVVCATKKRAMELLGASASHMRDMFSPNETQSPNCASVWATPETVFQRKMDYPDTDNWKPLSDRLKLNETKGK